MTDAAGSRGGASNPAGAPAVTVVTATYNNSATLRLALQSLLLQDWSDFEAWVVGDACTDDSAEVVAAFGDPRLHWLNLARNSGSQSAPNNEGLRRARGEYVAYLGHDDLWFPWHLSGLLAFARERQADLVHPLSAVFGPRGLEFVVGPPGRRRTYSDHFVYPSSWLHRRALREECGLWRDQEELGTGPDMDYLRRIHRAGKRIGFLEQLSVLKFPSAYWRMYALPAEPPQLAYLRALREDPEALHRRLLLEIATAFARDRWGRPSPAEQARALLRSSLRELLDFYGRERWPLSRLWRWRFQRARRRLRARRGLPG
ncbi:MAG: glycosyltransferase family 2 protein [Thermoanaerobaculia bacterium]